MIPLILAALTSLTAVDDSYPCLSRDGRELVFSSTRSGKRAIWIAHPDGSNPRMLFDGGQLGERPATPIWSPDSTRIVFAMTPKDAALPTESEIYVMNADGRNIRRLTHAPGDDSHPHWSSDGKRIFFNSARATPELKAEWSKQWIDIYSMAPDGGDVRRYTDCKEICTYPVPSPDGRFVAHRRVTPTPGLTWELDPGVRNSEIFVTALDGASAVNVSNSVAYDGWPMWSPDGHWLVFSSNRDRLVSVGQIYAVRPDGTGLRPITNGAISRVQPSFSPDGKHLLVFEEIETPGFEIGHIARVDLEDLE